MARNLVPARSEGGTMIRPLKLALGVMWFGAGAAALYANGWAIILTMSKAGGGVPLVNVGGVLLASCCLGAAANCFGWMQPTHEPEKSNVANSVWANAEHLRTFDILED